jgi:hypothetical protein
MLACSVRVYRLTDSQKCQKRKNQAQKMIENGQKGQKWTENDQKTLRKTSTFTRAIESRIPTVQRPSCDDNPRDQIFNVTPGILSFQSPPRAEGASTPPARRRYSKNAVTSRNLQLHFPPCSYMPIPQVHAVSSSSRPLNKLRRASSVPACRGGFETARV